MNSSRRGANLAPRDRTQLMGRVVLLAAVVACAALVVVTVFGNRGMGYFTPFLFGPAWLGVMLGFAAVAVWSLVRLRHLRAEGWRAALPALVCGVTVVALIALPLPGVHPLDAHPSDEEMVRDFTLHRESYTTLLEMFEADPKLERLGDLAGDWPPDPADAGVDSARLDRYRSLMSDLGVQSLEGSMDRVLFIISTFGLAVSGSSKGYLYSTEPPAPLVGDTETWVPQLYRPIVHETCWFCRQEASSSAEAACIYAVWSCAKLRRERRRRPRGPASVAVRRARAARGWRAGPP